MSYSKKQFSEGDDAALPKAVAGNFEPINYDETAVVPPEAYEKAINDFAPQEEVTEKAPAVDDSTVASQESGDDIQ